jgi:tetratricopeptide (TPR) repeat protein
LNWQEYQEAVGELYIQMEGIGNVKKNITLPDKITGQPRQVDVWLEIETKSHKLGVLIDAKYRKHKIDVKDVEEVMSLANAVGANKSVLIASIGWTAPAKIKAGTLGLDLRLFTIEEALELIVSDNWRMCPACENDCIVLDCTSGMVVDGVWSLLTAGQCRECRSALILCSACGDRLLLKAKERAKCSCSHVWKNKVSEVLVKPRFSKQWSLINSGQSEDDWAFLDTNFYISEGVNHRKQGNIKQAILDFNKAIELSPNSAIAYYHRANTCDEAGDLDQAIYDYTKSLELDVNLAMAYASRGIAYYATGKLQQALSDFEQYLSLSPDTPYRALILNTIQYIKLELNSNLT